jgi:hypothetical protein
MAEGGNNTGIVALVAIFVLVVLVGFFGVRSGMFDEGGAGRTTNVDVDVDAPAKPSPSPSPSPSPAPAPGAQ